MRNNYDNIASLYDRLSRLVFGRAQVNVQLDLIHTIASNSRILIVGGGSGWILEALAKLYPQGLMITYVEISANMLRIARNRYYGNNKVVFVEQAIEDYVAAPNSYDVIITSFLFDNFLRSKAEKVFRHLTALLVNEGRWLYADFYLEPQKKNRWKKGMLHLMYKFFGYVCRVEAKKLIDMEPYFQENGYRVLFCSLRYFGFVKGIVYQK
ncbi:class I SAM-dependent methyltransferase [Olivibacter sp. CPCC 100613]|uniref:class I SAM-dependent methyltransferase n=1 Tax=Olivibacter sp. CPCC 100613 TaxID=3079931 RepID=UPI002FF846C9